MAPSLLRKFYKGNFAFIISASHRKKWASQVVFFLLKLFYMPLKLSLFCSLKGFFFGWLFWFYFGFFVAVVGGGFFFPREDIQSG